MFFFNLRVIRQRRIVETESARCKRGLLRKLCLRAVADNAKLEA